MLKLGRHQGLVLSLSAVVASSLFLLAYGLHTPSGPIEVLQLPVAGAQLFFIAAVMLEFGWRGFLAPLTRLQRFLIALLIIYMVFVSATSYLPSAKILVSSWVVHIVFFVALISFFRNADLDRLDIIWSVLGLTAFIHACAFFTAWTVWPEEVNRMHVPVVGHIRHLGYFLTPVVTVMAVQFITRLDKAYSSIVFFAAAAFFIIYTGQRGGAVAVIAGLLATGAYLAWRRQHINVDRTLILLGVVGALILFSELLPAIPDWPPVFGRGLDAIDQTETQVLTGRNVIWASVWTAIEQNWLWGHGPGILNEVANQRAKEYQPHNIGLQLLLHWGVFGTFITLATVTSFASNVWAALLNRSGLAGLPFAILATMLVHALVSGNLFYPFSIVTALVAFTMLEAIGWQQACLTQNKQERVRRDNK